MRTGRIQHSSEQSSAAQKLEQIKTAWDRPRDRGKFIKSEIEGTFTGQSTFGFVPIDLIRIDPIYQRNKDSRRIVRMAHSWNQDLVGSPVFSLRDDGFYYVVDGQQRYEAFMLVHNHPSHIWGQVFSGLTQKDEAELFAKLDTERQGLSQGSKFKALLVAEDSNAIEIKGVAEEYGLSVDNDKGPVINNLRAYAALFDIHRRVGREGLSRILKITSSSWPNSKYSGASSIILGLETFLTKYPQANDKHLINVLSNTTTGLIENQARALGRRHAVGRGTLIKNVAQIILDEYYNKRLRTNRLPDWSA